MAKLAEVLEPLSPEARSRAIAWVTQALQIIGSTPTVPEASTAGQPAAAAPTEAGFKAFAEMFHAANPRSEKEKALLAGYWIQRSAGVDQFNAQQINAELKHIGYGVLNITDALSQLIADKPNLVIQLAKSGSSRQARKTYKVTDAGNRRVQEMLNGGVPGK
ncbi:MAG TPA: hypothetical protein VHA70_02280 [Bauldia sp.]|nr:hypothetical protein [Bauldia sp.]